jgi:PAS domain S-box-containing protein
MSTDTATRRPLCVLLAGDEDWQAATAMRLAGQVSDAAVRTATTADGLLSALATGPLPDAVVVAPGLTAGDGDGDGVGLAARVSRTYPELPVLVSAADEATARRAREAGLPVFGPGTTDGSLIGRLAAAALRGRRPDRSDPGPGGRANGEGTVDPGDGRGRDLRAFVEAVEQSGHSIYVTDRDGTIEYVNPTFEEISGYSRTEAVGRNPRILQSGHHDEAFYADVWETILSGEVWEGDIVNRRKDGELYHVHQTVAPITDEDGTVERFVAVNADITERKRREQEIERQRDLLDRLNSINAAVWDVSQALLRAGTRDGIERAVCERLVATGLYESAWIGGYDATAGRVTPRTGAGVDVDALDAVEAGGDGPPSVRVARSGEVAVVEDAAERAGPLAVVALAYEEVTHGVLHARGEPGREVDEYERTSLRELGETVGYAVGAARTRRLLDAADTVELTLRSRDDRSPLVAASTAGCRVELSAAVPGTDDRELYYLRVGGEEPAAGVDRLREREGVERLRVAREDEEGGWLVELAVTGPSLARALADSGAHTVSATAVDGEVELVAELPLEADVRGAVRAARTAFPDLELVAKRTVERPADRPRVERHPPDRLTDRQRATLRAAYHGGYFDWPRASTAQELAETMGVSDVTFHKHLRRAERRLLEGYFGDG